LPVQARRALDEVGELLRQKQLEYKERMRVCDDREATLTARQEQTRESVTKFAKFMKENDAKRARALKRAADEAKLRAEKDLEVEQTALDYERTQLKFQKMQGALDSWLKFQRFLEKVVDMSDDFAEIDNVIAWHDTLSGTNRDLQLGVTERMEGIERTRALLADTVKTMQNDILVKSSMLAGLREQLERERQASMVREMSQLLKESDLKDKIRVLGEATMAINNLWRRCRYKQQSSPKASDLPSNVISSLRGVQNKFIEIRDVALEAKRLSELAAPVAVKPLPQATKKSDKTKGRTSGAGDAADAMDKAQPPSLQASYSATSSGSAPLQ
jgi:hypothetical protein